MKRVGEFTVFVAIAVGAHLAVASYAPSREGAQAAGNEGAAAVSLQAASASVADMVERWETPPDVPAAPDVPSAPQVEMPAPQMPQSQADSSPVAKAPDAPGLAMPQPERLPDQSAMVSPAPPPEAPKPEPEVNEDTAKLADTRPAARPKPPAPRKTPQKPATTSNSRSSAAQKASGQGGGADAGSTRAQRAATLSASQRQSLTAQWGAQVRRKIERGKRYPGGARGASGTVRVRITVGRDGSLRGVSLAGSSGHRALDEAALRAVRAAGHFPNAPRGLSKPTYTFTLPMRFSG
ncbi:MAG TPA: TonB family protein [Roseovarius sp.]|nr:TonB family protein [Roseovarius sp.]